MKLFEKKFEELSTNELFKILKLRCSVFIVEQSCPYQDIDEQDREALHLWLEEGGEILAYLRVLPAGTVFEEASIGRVISVNRRSGNGTKIVSEGIRAAKEAFGAEAITIEAQLYAKSLYEKLGFVQISQPFLEDGIEHVKMRIDLK